MTNISKRKEKYSNFEGFEDDDHDEFLHRISKSLYYAKIPQKNYLTLPVNQLAAELFTQVQNGHSIQRLQVEEASRISRNACASPCALVLALLYLERLKDCNPEYLQRTAPSELFLVSLMIASKFLNDDGEEDQVFNSMWAKAGRLSVQALNHLEQQFLSAIDWTIYVHRQDFWEKLQRLEKDLAYKEGLKRGWFSYTELCSLLNNTQLLPIVRALLGVSSVCLVAYTAGVMTILGATFIASQIPGSVFAPKQPLSLQGHEISLAHMHDKWNICEGCRKPLKNENRTHENNGNDHWWLNSVMIWIPEHSNSLLEAKKIFKLKRNFATSTESEFMDWNEAFRDLKSLPPTEINWKETLHLASKRYSFNFWRDYLHSASKILITSFQF